MQQKCQIALLFCSCVCSTHRNNTTIKEKRNFLTLHVWLLSKSQSVSDITPQFSSTSSPDHTFSMSWQVSHVVREGSTSLLLQHIYSQARVRDLFTGAVFPHLVPTENVSRWVSGVKSPFGRRWKRDESERISAELAAYVSVHASVRL